MKNLLTLFLAIGVLAFLSGASVTATAQKGLGASAGQGHGEGGSHDQAKTGSDVKGDHDSHTNWQAKFNERLQDHPELAARIDKLLGKTDLMTAEDGFKGPGQFIAAMHVSKNLNIPFELLKAKVTGVTTLANGQTSTTTPMSLGKAIQELRPNMTTDQANDAAKRAEKEASETEKAGPKVSD